MSLNSPLAGSTTVTFVERKELRSFVALGLALGIPFFLLSFLGVVRLVVFAGKQGLDNSNGHLLISTSIVLLYALYRLYIILRTARDVLSSIESTDSGLIGTVSSGKRFQIVPSDLATAQIRNAPVKRLATTSLAKSILKSVSLPTGRLIINEEWLPRIFEIAGLKE
jgi:hypothetical protein